MYIYFLKVLLGNNVMLDVLTHKRSIFRYPLYIYTYMLPGKIVQILAYYPPLPSAVTPLILLFYLIVSFFSLCLTIVTLIGPILAQTDSRGENADTTASGFRSEFAETAIYFTTPA